MPAKRGTVITTTQAAARLPHARIANASARDGVERESKGARWRACVTGG
jgi:hypothetical protein